MTVLGIFLILLSFPFLKMGTGALKDRRVHEEYGVESENVHVAFSWVLLLLGVACACGGGWILAG